MEEKHYDVEAVKSRLGEYRELIKEIDTQYERLERLKAKMYSMGAQTLTDMPKSTNHANDRIANLIEEKEELESEIGENIEKKRKERKCLEDVIKHLRRSDERSVIRIRYFDCASWNDVVDVMFGDRADLLEREEIYLRRVYKLHGQALLGMAKYIEENDPDRSNIKA